MKYTPKYDKQLIISDYKNGLSLPDLHVKYGINTTYAYSILSQAKVMRTLSTAMILKRSGNASDWRKLVRMRPKGCSTTNTRLVSIPTSLLNDLKVDPDKDLVGKWSVNKGKLVLEVKEVSER